MSKYDWEPASKGMCRVCGRPTKLFVHAECGATIRAGIKAHKTPAIRKYQDAFITWLIKR